MREEGLQGSMMGENPSPPQLPTESRDVKCGIMKIIAQTYEEEKRNEKLQYKTSVQELLC